MWKCKHHNPIYVCQECHDEAVNSYGITNNKEGEFARAVAEDIMESEKRKESLFYTSLVEDGEKVLDLKFQKDINMKPSNPKDIIGSDKLPLELWPPEATAMGSLGMLEGALKYGRNNFKAIGVRSSIYIAAAKRHLDAWFEGEENAPDSGVPHLSNALACIAIIVVAKAIGNLVDDRNYPGGYRKLVDELTPHVKRLKELHKDKEPRHYTIEDKDV